MPLSIGERLGPYEILAPIGAGGMGEVYMANDTRLDRTVAIKLANAEFSERFEREARAVAALNHPHICQLYDVGPNYIVMEYIEGAPLNGPLPLGQTLKYAAQICEALDAAHRKGITHRDLKPANILVTKAGIKLLDFGLAKLSAKAQPSKRASDETLTMALTGQNVIVGTLYYMSPEQLQAQATDKELDGRSDIFSFGLVLYELLTGKRAFEGTSPASIIAAIMERPAPSISDIAPASLDRVLKRCLEKDADNRWQTARDLKAELEWIANAPVETAAIAPPAPVRFKWLWPGVAGLSALLAAVALWAWASRAPVPMAATRLSVLTPVGRPVVIPGSPSRSLAISLDGTHLVYVGAAPAMAGTQPGLYRPRQLLLRPLDSPAVRELPGTSGAQQPFFSPDGRWIAFFAGTDLMKVSLAGGKPILVAEKVKDSAPGSFGVWTEDGDIVFGTSTSGLNRVSAEGGKVTQLTSLDTTRNESHNHPAVIQSSRTVLFSAGARIEAVAVDSGKRSVVLENASHPVALSSGHLLFWRGGDAFAAPFDAKNLTVTGPAVPLAEPIGLDGGAGRTPEMSVSRNGTIAYLPAKEIADVLGLVGRDGKFQPLSLPPGEFERPRVSPDGRSIAYFSGYDRYVYDLERGSSVKVTQNGRDYGFAWHPDGRSQTYESRRDDGAGGIFLKKPDGAEQLLIPLEVGITRLWNFSWSPDGKRLAYTVQKGGVTHIWIHTLGEKLPTEPLIKGRARGPKFSPDGKWLAYDSDESGRYEVYLQPYPQGERIEVSTRGGDSPVWRRDGTELYFQGYSEGTQKKTFAVSVTPNGASLRLGKPVALFDLSTAEPSGDAAQYRTVNNPGAGYDVLPDGRFVMVRGADRSDFREIVVVQNWFEELKRNIPVK